jgi:hypothetical protein
VSLIIFRFKFDVVSTKTADRVQST